MKKEIFLIVLAGGESKRFGENKLEFGEYPMLERVLDNLQTLSFAARIVVLGRRSFHLEAMVKMKGLLPIKSEKSYLGMGYSLARGVEEIISTYSSKEKFGIIFVLGDMPFIKSKTFKKIVDTFINEEHDIIVPTYRGKRGNPVILSSVFVDEILSLGEDKGARDIIKRNSEKIKFVEFETDEILKDIDCRG